MAEGKPALLRAGVMGWDKAVGIEGTDRHPEFQSDEVSPRPTVTRAMGAECMRYITLAGLGWGWGGNASLRPGPAGREPCRGASVLLPLSWWGEHPNQALTLEASALSCASHIHHVVPPLHLFFPCVSSKG